MKQQDRPIVFVAHSLGGVLIGFDPLLIYIKFSVANLRSLI